MRKLKSHLPFTVACCANVYDSKFALLSCIPVLHQDGLPFFDWRGQRDQAAVSVHGKHLRELAKTFPEHILPIGAYAHS